MSESAAVETALIIGATSMLGRELALGYAASGWRVALAARDAEELKRVASDVGIRSSSSIETMIVDIVQPHSVDEAAANILRSGVPRVTIFVAGASNDAAKATLDVALAQDLLAINYSGQARLVAALLPALKKAPGSSIVFVSSVAGDRGRKGNFVYGAAKAALNTYAQGLRALLLPHNVNVVTVKLGYMDTRLAYGMTPPALTASPRYVARAIRRAVERGRMVVYVPPFWRWILLILRIIPERIFIRLPIP